MLHIRRDFENMSAEECTAQLVRVMDDDGIRIFTDNPVAYVLGIKEYSSDYVTGTTYMVPHLLITGPAGSGKTSFINTVILSMIRKYKKPEELGHSFLADPEISRMVLKEPDTWG